MSQDGVAEVSGLGFQVHKTDNLFVRFHLHVPCYQSELDEFLKEAKRFGGKEVQLAPNLTAVFERGGTVNRAVQSVPGGNSV